MSKKYYYIVAYYKIKIYLYTDLITNHHFILLLL
nr:MAG TPA: hypothetical protein [Crassvirales sp.]DAU41266.1 MAG TPA: hypothetical protein [Crassvirales sp.]